MIYFFDSYESLNIGNAEFLLPPERYERFLRLRQMRDKENCLVAYLLLKRALKDSGIEEFSIKADEYGKPYLEGNEVYFNLSHCKYGAAAAVSTSPVGIDIQEITEYKKGVAERIFSEEEIELIESSENADKDFTRLWTLKEAAAKCDGRGISVLKNFSFESCGNSFTKYGRDFKVFERKNLFISVCGNGDFSDITQINSLEDFK